MAKALTERKKCMDIGVSTSCFYPLETEKSLEEIGKLDIHTAEVFFNAYEELGTKYLEEFNSIRNHYGINIVSVHPFTAPAESSFFFSSYKRRFYEMVEFYKHYMLAANEIGAKIVVIHGSRLPCEVSDEEYCERFAYLADEGRKQGITVAQENIFSSCSHDPAFLRKMKNYMGDDFKMVFDVKQMKKSGYELNDFLPEFSDSVVHVHISDNDTRRNCLPPGKGNFEFEKLFGELKKVGYDGSFIIELYRTNYGEYSELKECYNFLKSY